MKARTARVVVAAMAIGGLIAGCGHDRDAGTDAAPPDAGMDSSQPTCPATAPGPMNQMGACCYRASNASRPGMPELRIAGLKINSPASLASSVIRGALARSLDAEQFIWLIELSGAPPTGVASIMVKTGVGGRNTDGSYQFAVGDAPTPGVADRWDPVALMGTMDDEVVTTLRATQLVTLAWFLDPYHVGVPTHTAELPLRGLRFESTTLSDGRSCVGVRGTSSYDVTAGHLSAFLTVADSSRSTLALEVFGSGAAPGYQFVEFPLCMVVADVSSMPGNCADYPQSEWVAQPDSRCDAAGCVSNLDTPGTCDPASTCTAWKLTADFAAQGVEIL